MSWSINIKSTSSSGFLKKLQDKASNDMLLGITKENNERPDSEQTNADILATHVFGSIINNIPKRDPLIAPINRNKKDIIDKLKLEFLKYTKESNGENVKEFLEKSLKSTAFFVLNDIVKGEILTNGQGQWTPLAEKTIERKLGKTTMLIDTKELFDKLTFEIV